jgi:hypothetical protein
VREVFDPDRSIERYEDLMVGRLRARRAQRSPARP